MGALDGLDVEIEAAGGWVGANGGIATVGERAGLAVAETSYVVFVSAEVLVFGGKSGEGVLDGVRLMRWEVGRSLLL